MATRYPIGCTLGLVLGGLALQAMAEPQTTPISNNNGLMTFPNVRVEHAPTSMKAAKPTSPQQKAMLAHVDPHTGELTDSAADAAQLATSAARASAARTRVITATAQAAPEIIYGPGNTQAMALGDEHMMFQTARQSDDGRLMQECVKGETQAKQSLQSPAAQQPRHINHQHKDGRHDH